MVLSANVSIVIVLQPCNSYNPLSIDCINWGIVYTLPNSMLIIILHGALISSILSKGKLKTKDVSMSKPHRQPSMEVGLDSTSLLSAALMSHCYPSLITSVRTKVTRNLRRRMQTLVFSTLHITTTLQVLCSLTCHPEHTVSSFKTTTWTVTG